MLPVVGVPPAVADGLAPYRDLFCREAGFQHLSRYLTGLLLSPHKTLQGIYGLQVWAPGQAGVSRRAMHAAVFEAGWDSAGLLARHRAVVAGQHRGRGLEVIGLDWTYVHHDRGPTIDATKRRYDHVQGRMSHYQTRVTATVANAHLIDGIAVDVQFPHYPPEELAYLSQTAAIEAMDLGAARQRFIDRLHYHKNRLAYRKRPDIAVEIVRQLESEGHFPQAHYGFDNGVLSLALTQSIERHGKHWVAEVECSRLIQWQGQWRRIDGVDAELVQQHPASFRPLQVTWRNGEENAFWVLSKAVRLKRYGRKRLVIVHEQADLRDPPRFLLTDALHWEGSRVIRVWSYRWPVEIFHEFCKQVVGLEAAQVRQEEAVNRHFRLSCVAQSLLQRTPAGGKKSERFAFAGDDLATVGQKIYTLTRQVFGQLLLLVQGRFHQGQSHAHVLERLMPT